MCSIFCSTKNHTVFIENRLKCHTKIHIELVLLFSLLLKTFATVDNSFMFIIMIMDYFLKANDYPFKVFPIYYSNGLPYTIASQVTTSTDEENRTDSDTDLSAENTEDEIHANTSTWSSADKKKLQHMTEFHQEYKHIFREGSSIRTIMKRRISNMNPPMPKSVCEEEIESTHLDNNEVIIKYLTNAYFNKIKKLKPIFIKSEPDREYTHHVVSDDDLPAVPEEKFTQKREVTIDSYSESISSNDEESSDYRTMTGDRDSSPASTFEEALCKWEANSKGIEATLHQIVAGLQSAAEGYLTLASHMSKVGAYVLPQVIAQIPPPPMNFPMPI